MNQDISTKEKRSKQVTYYLCAALALHCGAPPSMVIKNLTGHLWDEEEAYEITDCAKENDESTWWKD